MKKIILSIKGFTVIEMMIAIIIAGLIIAAISSFFIVHFHSYKSSEKMIDLQYNGQVSINEISNIAIQAQGIYRICIYNELNILEEVDLQSTISKTLINQENEYAVFIINSQDIDEFHIIKLNKNNDLNYYISKESDLSNPIDYGVIGKNIKSINLSPIDGTSFKDSNSIEIEVELEKDDFNLTVNSQAKYRNKSKN